MSKRGEELLIGIGKLPKKKPAEVDEPDADDEGGETEGDDDAPMGAVVAAEDFCREAGIDEEKAPAIAKLIRQIAGM